MFVFASIAVIVLLAAIAVAYVVAPDDQRWTFVSGGAALALTLGGAVTAIVVRVRFGSLEPQNEWASAAFAQFSRPLTVTAIAVALVLAASVLTAKRRSKTVLCLAAAPVFALLVFGYTALFAYMTKGGALDVETYICVYGCAIGALVGAADVAAEAKRLYADRKSADKSARGGSGKSGPADE